MAFDYTNFFGAIGAMGGMIRNNAMGRGTVVPTAASKWGAGTLAQLIHDLGTMNTNLLGFVGAPGSGRIDQKYLTNYYAALASYQQSQTSAIQSFITTTAQSFIQNYVNSQVPLASVTLKAALQALIAQMKTDSKSIQQNVVTVTATAFSGSTGNAIITASVIDPILTDPAGTRDVSREFCIPETITCKCTQDVNTGGAAGSEQITLTSPALFTLAFDPTWPGSGSGINKTMVICNQLLAGSNLLTNGSFETFAVVDNPDTWTYLVGVATTNFGMSSTVYGSSLHSLQFTGVAVAQSLAQTLNNNYIGSIKPNSVYALCGFLRVSVANGGGAGVFVAELVDGANAVINDNGGIANLISTADAVNTAVSAMASTVTWYTFQGYFRTPQSLPSTVKIRLRMSTGQTSGNVLLDSFALLAATELYPGGPYAAAFRGSTDMAVGGSTTIVVANSMGNYYGTPSQGLMQTTFQVVCGMSGLGLQLPSSAAGTAGLSDATLFP